MALIDAFRHMLGEHRHLFVKTTATDMLKNVRGWFASDPSQKETDVAIQSTLRSDLLTSTKDDFSKGKLKSLSFLNLVEVAYESVATMLTPTKRSQEQNRSTTLVLEEAQTRAVHSSSNIQPSVHSLTPALESSMDTPLYSSSSSSVPTVENELEYKLIPGYMEIDPLKEASKGFRFDSSRKKAKDVGSMFISTPDNVWFTNYDL